MPTHRRPCGVIAKALDQINYRMDRYAASIDNEALGVEKHVP